MGKYVVALSMGVIVRGRAAARSAAAGSGRRAAGRV